VTHEAKVGERAERTLLLRDGKIDTVSDNRQGLAAMGAVR
jgi:hypothetical protein